MRDMCTMGQGLEHKENRTKTMHDMYTMGQGLGQNGNGKKTTGDTYSMELSHNWDTTGYGLGHKENSSLSSRTVAGTQWEWDW